MALHGLTTLTLGVPDPVSVGAYYEDFGLTALGDGRYATVNGGEQLRLVPSDRRRAVGLGIGCDDADDLDRVAHDLGVHGFESAREEGAVTAYDAGTGVEVRVEVAPRLVEQPEPGVTLNAPGDVRRRNLRSEAILRDESVLRPRKLGHIVLSSLDEARSRAFFVQGVGFKVSDLTKEGLAFMRCSQDHHNLALREAPIQFVHHTSWELPDVDAVGAAAMAMIQKDSERHVWGLGRHDLGSNYFWYLKDPAGNFSEYYSDMDAIVDDAEWEAGLWEGVKSFYSWGPPPPKQMRDPEDLAALMMGAHSR